jgi:hypothetical protein
MTSFRTQSEDLIEEQDQSQHIPFRQPSHLAFPDHVHDLISLDRPPGPVKGSEPLAGVDPSFDRPMILFNGLITNDKFCLSRVSRQKLRYTRRPRTLPCQAVDSYAYPRDEEHRGGAHEATVESPSSVSADHECPAAVGPGLPTSPGMDLTDRPGPRSTGFVSPSSGSGGEI